MERNSWCWGPNAHIIQKLGEIYSSLAWRPECPLAVGTLLSFLPRAALISSETTLQCKPTMSAQTAGRNCFKMHSWSEQNHYWNAHFFILSSILLLNTAENTEISHAQRHNSRRRKAAQSFLFWPSSYTFHVALIIKRGKVWGRAIQLNHTPLPCCEERNSKVFYFAYWVVKFCIISKVYLTSPCINEIFFVLFVSENSAVFWRYHSPSSFLTTYFCTAENDLLFAQQHSSSSCGSCRGKHLSQQYQTLLLRPLVPKSCIDFAATELMLPRHPSCSCADRSRREPCPRTRATAELQSLSPLGWFVRAGVSSLCTFLELGIFK